MSMEEIIKKMLVLRTRDEEEFKVEESVAQQSITIKNMVEDLGECASTVIPIPNVEGETLTKVIEYLNMHAETSKATEEEVKKFDEHFFDETPMNKIFDVLLAANYLNISGLFDLSCQSIADHIKNKSVAYVRKLFNIQNDFTKEEEKAINGEHPWAFVGVDKDDA